MVAILITPKDNEFKTTGSSLLTFLVEEQGKEIACGSSHRGPFSSGVSFLCGNTDLSVRGSYGICKGLED